MPLPSVSADLPVLGAAAGPVVAPSAQWNWTSRIAALALSVCTATAVQGAVLADRGDGCTDLSTDNAVLPDDVISAWQCDLDARPEPRVSATSSSLDGESDTRLMLIVGLSSGAGWLARGLHRD